MEPSKVFTEFFKVLTAHDKRKMRFGKFLVTVLVTRIWEHHVVAEMRIFEVSGFLGLKRKLLYALDKNIVNGVPSVELLFEREGAWYEELKRELNNL